jgi:hypothetical protein
MFLRNVGIYLQVYTASPPRTTKTTTTTSRLSGYECSLVVLAVVPKLVDSFQFWVKAGQEPAATDALQVLRACVLSGEGALRDVQG